MIGGRWVDKFRRKLVNQRRFTSAQVASGEHPLLVLAGVGPAQIVLAESVRAAWSDSCAVVWLEQCSEAAADSLRQVAANLCATRVIAVGLEAVYAARDALPELPIEGMFLHHELDFRFSNKHRQNRLLGGFSACRRLWFDSTVAMDKAAAHGSDRPHLLIPLPALSTPSVDIPAAVNVAIVTSHDKLTAAEERTVETLREEISEAGGHPSVRSVDQLYTSEDLQLDRTWGGALLRGLPDQISHAVLIGKSGHHIFAALGLQSCGIEVFVEATVENSAIARRVQLSEYHTARGAALTERVVTAVSKRSRKSPSSTPPNHSAGAFRTAVESVVTEELPNWHEESILEANQSEFDVFFSVAAIENRNNGARPQRIRAMSQSFEEPGVPLVRMTSNLNLLRRRLRGALSLAKSGARPRWGYGENSTAPMPAETLVELENGLKELRQAGLRFAWYVRDFHWLDPASPVSQSRTDISELRANGLAEFTTMREIADVLFAPSDQAAQMFNELLQKHIKGVPNIWRALPPGIDPANCLSASVPHSGQSENFRILYAGGIGGVYDLGTAMTALASLNGNWELRMTVRPEDLHAANQLTSAMSGHLVDITSCEFTDTPVPEGATVGLALLDSYYGLASYPLKVMSYLEKRIPVLVYRNSSPAGLIDSYGAGLVTDRAPESVKAGLEAVMSGSDSVDWQLLQQNESWSARAESVRKVLRTLSDR